MIPRLRLLLASKSAFACAVCFGKNDNPGLVLGLGWGIAILVGATGLCLAGLAAMVAKIEKTKAKADELPAT